VLVLAALLEFVRVDTCSCDNGNGPFAAQAVLVFEKRLVGLPVFSVFLGAASCNGCQMRILVKGKWQVFVNKSHEAFVDIVLLELRQCFIMKLLAVGAFEVAELDDGYRGSWASHEWITFDANGCCCWLFGC